MKINVSNLIIRMFALYIILKPLYVFQNLPFQPADALLLFNLLVLMLTERVSKKTANLAYITSILKVYLLIVAYQFLINTINYLYVVGKTVESISLLKNNLYYIFNFLTMLYAIKLYKRYKNEVFVAFTTGSYYSMLLVLVGLILNYGKTSRNMSFFNNPNQLGYYALIMLTGVVLLGQYCSLFKKTVIIIISILGLLVSGSKASIIGAGVLFGFLMLNWIIKRFTTASYNKIVLNRLFPVVIVVSIILAFHRRLITVLQPYINSFSRRLDATVFSTSALGDSRGYNRIGDIGFNIIQGVGEGAFYRFSVMTGNETHSSFATILVSYGVIGMILYIIMFWNTIARKWANLFPFIVTFSGVLFYWVSHNGLRNSLFWILIVFFTVIYGSRTDSEGLDNNERLELR